MKKLLITLSCLLINTAFLLGQNTELTQEISSPVQSAIVYLYGAEVSHSKLINLNPGKNKIVFTGLSPKLTAKSIQVNVTGDVSILAISDAINYMANQKESNRIKQLKDSVTSLNDAISLINNDKDAYATEKNMLLKNDAIGGSEKGVAIAELKLAADFYRSRIKEINAEILKLDQKSKTLNESLFKANQQLNELNAKNNQPTAEITILLSAPLKTTTTLSLKYIVTDAGWAPSYDLHAEDVNQPIELKYRAKVFNNTGIDWNDIKIKLSTSDPSQSAAKPILSAWNLDYNAGINYKAKSSYGYSNSPVAQSNEGYMLNSISATQAVLDDSKKNKKTVQTLQFEEIQVSELSAEFDIKSNYSIPADSKPYIVDVTEYKLPATYQHYSVPKLVRDAFLLARITGWEDLDLVEGPANVYYGGTYVGQSYIYTRSADDTLDLSLGRDNKVLVTRSKVKEYCTKKMFGNTTKETFTYEMIVKNNRKTPVQIDIEDQLPVSTQSDIIVEAVETTKAVYDSKTGKLTWTYTLQPGDSKKITLSFAVKYPKNTNLNLQKTKTQMRAVF
ncbi:MAG: mucoidy inhibitor MuiA family protein [Bacteroidota bacterium]